MKEIKFRIYFKSIDEYDESFMSEPITIEELLHNGNWVEFENKDRTISLPIEDLRFFYNVNENYEIMQYTGLKDKNGQEIYEGDILKIPEWLLNNNKNEKCVCIYNEEHQCNDIIGFGLYMKESYSGEYKDLVPSDEWDEFEVIGNIYENPELLGKEN